MHKSITFTAFAAVLSVSGLVPAAANAPASAYAGHEARAVKSLSEQEVSALLASRGASLGKAAELNGYPGPALVLELAEPRHLDTAQLAATRQLMAAHNGRARQLGADLVASERELDTLFANKPASPALIDQATQRVGALHARLGAEHLTTHLTQTALLNTEQVRQYSALRGYAKAAADAPTTGDTSPAPDSSHRH